MNGTPEIMVMGEQDITNIVNLARQFTFCSPEDLGMTYVTARKVVGEELCTQMTKTVLQYAKDADILPRHAFKKAFDEMTLQIGAKAKSV